MLETTLEVQILLQQLYDMLELVNSLQMVYTMTQYTDFTKAFFILKMSYSFMVHT